MADVVPQSITPVQPVGDAPGVGVGFPGIQLPTVAFSANLAPQPGVTSLEMPQVGAPFQIGIPGGFQFSVDGPKSPVDAPVSFSPVRTRAAGMTTKKSVGPWYKCCS